MEGVPVPAVVACFIKGYGYYMFYTHTNRHGSRPQIQIVLMYPRYYSTQEYGIL